MKRTIVLILLMICGMATMKGQNPFGSHTTNTLFPNEDAKAIIQNKGKNWKCYGARHFDAKSGKYHCIVDTTYLESAVFAGRPYKNLEISINFYVENNARIYHIELINTETGETQLLKTEWKGQAGEKRFTYRLEDIDSDSLKIKIQNTAKDGTGSHAYIGSISVSGTPREPAPLIVCDTLDISISQTDSTYDRAIVQLLAVKNTRQDIDTLYYNDFSTDDLKGAEAQGSYKIGIGSYPATGRIFFDQTSDEPVALTIPLQIAGTSNEFHVEFQTRRLDIGTDSTDIRLALRDNLVATIGKKTLRETLTQHKHTIPAREIYSDLIFSVGEKGIKSCNNLFLSQLLVYQKSRYKYTPLSGFPRTTDGDMKIEGLEPNTNYVLAIQYVRESNEHGERVVTPVREYHLTTQGKYAEILPGETLELSADFKGSIALHDGGQLRGNHTILGELCYVKKYTPDVW